MMILYKNPITTMEFHLSHHYDDYFMASKPATMMIFYKKPTTSMGLHLFHHCDDHFMASSVSLQLPFSSIQTPNQHADPYLTSMLTQPPINHQMSNKLVMEEFFLSLSL